MTRTNAEALSVPYGYAALAPVHFDDLDPMGMLHNARYAVLLERTIATWWAQHGVSFADGRPTTPDVFSAVREFAITYRAPMRGTGVIAVHFWVERVGGTSVDYRFRMTSPDGGTVYADGRRAAVRIDPATLRPAPWTEHGRELAAAITKI
ncbi:MAG: thioesterase family protein [Actinomycetota bacterium]|nr:thioesterase family protein [Actinomycetota bacterium]